MSIDFEYIPHGKTINPSDNNADIYLDIGGRDDELIFDHHFPGSPDGCSADLVYRSGHTDRMEKLRARLKNNHVIRLAIHVEPDLDCACAAWLIKHYLEEGDFPKGADWVTKYASAVDSGKLKINGDRFFVPATVMYAFYETAKLERIKDTRRFDSKEKEFDWILEQAFKLLDWCAANLAGVIDIDDRGMMDDGAIFNLLCNSNMFPDEYDILKEDRKKYEEEISNPSICQRIDNYQIFTDEGEPKGVYALIYSRVPKSTLTKYWARMDGFIFTLIPLECSGRWDNEPWRPSGFSVPPTRVILSVPPEEKYDLKPLAKQLERAECEYENKILGSAAELKRTRTIVRKGYETEAWVTNNDPWYDGAATSHNHTIVDSPRSLSLLPISKIIDIAAHHTQRDITISQMVVIFPLVQEINEISGIMGGSEFIDDLNKHDGRWEPMRGGGSSDYLFDYVEKHLNVNGVCKEGAARWFENSTLPSVTSNAGDHTVLDDLVIKEQRIVWFPSNIAFLIVNLDTGCVDIEQLTARMRGIDKKLINIIDPSFDQAKKLVKNPLFMVFAEFNNTKYVGLDIGRDVFEASSFLDPTLPRTDGVEERGTMERLLLRVNAGTVFGQSRNCFILASSTPKSKDNYITTYEGRFLRDWLHEWILVQHQHWFMICLKRKFGASNSVKSKALFKLRSDLVDFTASSGFAQVTNDMLGAELYDRWTRLLNIGTLSEEVKTQVTALDENARQSFERMFEQFTRLFWPISVISSSLAIITSLELLKIATLELWAKIALLVILVTISMSFPMVYSYRRWRARRKRDSGSM